MGYLARVLGLGVGVGVASAVTVSAGCVVSTYACEQDEQCAGVGPSPRCEPSGYCSFEDTACDGGRRYGDAAPGDLARACVSSDPVASSGGEVVTSTSGTDSDPTIATLSTTSASSESSESSESSSSSGAKATSATTDIEPSCVGWWDCDWRSRVKVTIAAPTDEDLLGVPVPVVLARLPEIDDEDALRFVSDSGEVLPHEIDQGLAWVSLPELPGSSEVEVFAYFDNASAGPLENPAAVWAEPFALVVHGDDLEDASGHHELGESMLPSHSPAIFGDGLLFDGVDDAVVFGPDEASADLREDGLTLTAWVRVNPEQAADYPRIIDHTENADSQSGWTLAVAPGAAEESNRLRVDIGLELGESRVTFEESLPSQWFFLAVTISPEDETQARFDDVITDPLPSTGAGGAISDADNVLSLARSSHAEERWFAGEMDEVRVARGVRSAAWLETMYQLGGGDLVSVSDPEVAPTRSR